LGGCSIQSAWLTFTKFIPPRLAEDFVPRRRLTEALHGAIQARPFVLLSAPAGYGKTTLLASLPAAFPHLPIAWLSLDEDDNDPARFLSALVRALQQTEPEFGADTLTLLANLPDPARETRRVIGALINDILAELGRTWLVLDDLHLITEPRLHAALDYFLERMPSQLHLLVATRHDPPMALARLRARGQLAELRLHSLRFTFDETTAFLNDQLHLGLTSEELARLYADTEGWAAGLRLLANSLGQIPASNERAAIISHLNQTNTHIFDFLAEEVLARQSGILRNFLLETSILPELAPDLCQAVTERSDAAVILGDAYRRSLFLVGMDDTGTTFRYHHLFAQFLRRRLEQEMPERVAELHRRAAEAEANPARAVSHFLAGGLWEQAAEMMKQAGEQLLDNGYLHTLRTWIEALPPSVREAHHRLTYLLGVCALHRGELELASSLLERSRRGFEEAGDEAGEGEALIGLVNVASQQHDYPRQTRLIEEAFARPLSTRGRMQLLMARVWQSINEGAWEKADKDLDEALHITLESEATKTFVENLFRTHVALLPAGTDRLERFCRQELARSGESVGPVQASAHSLLGYINFLRGRLDEAIKEAERARSLSQRLGGFPFLDGEVHLVRASVYSARGDQAAVERYWEARLSWMEQTPAISFWTGIVLYYIGRAQWMQGKLEQARQTYVRMAAIKGNHELPEVTESRALMQALIEMSDLRYADAERTLHAAAAIEAKYPQCLVFSSVRLLLAHLYLAWSRPQAAASELAPVLAEFERRDMPGLILREGEIAAPLLRLAVERGIHPSFAARVLGLFGESPKVRRVRVPSTGESLTAREVEVLLLMAQGASNRQIAGQLVIAEATVKSHVTSILRKLNVTSRTRAAARARELGIV
jgi:LuxR family transcriptional regulator, maltose regulon positive regulatory protein